MENDPAGHPITQIAEGPPNYPPNANPDRPADVSASPDGKSGIMKRAMGRTTEVLSRSKSAGNKAPAMSQSQPSLPVSGHRRIFSLNRGKGKERASADGERSRRICNHGLGQDLTHGVDEIATAQSQYMPSSASPSLPRRLSGRSALASPDDDSPFITPRSPPFGPTRSVFNIFRGDGSVSLSALIATHS